MKKMVLSIYLMLYSLSASALQLPAQQSAEIVNKVASYVLTAKDLAFKSITKISLSNDSAKVELTDANGQCLAIPFVVTYDNQGSAQLDVDKLALAICD